MSNSFLVNWGVRIYNSIENSYDKSFLHRIIMKIGSLAKEGLIIGFIIKILFTESRRDFYSKSFILNLIDIIIKFFTDLLKKLYNYFNDVKNRSLAINISEIALHPIKNLGTLFNALGFLLIGFSFTRLVFFIIKYGISRTVLFINGILFIAGIILAFTNAENLENCFKNCLIFRLAKWFFTN